MHSSRFVAHCLQMSLGGSRNHSLAVLLDNRVPEDAVETLVIEGGHGLDNSLDTGGRKRNEVGIRIHEADVLPVGDDMNRITRQQCPPATCSLLPVEHGTAGEVTAAADQGQAVAELLGLAIPKNYGSVGPHDPRPVRRLTVWVEGAAPRLGLTTTLANNFSVGGATTGTVNTNETLLGADLPGLADELDWFVESYGPAADPNALYVIWAGSNDFFLPFTDPVPVITQAVTNVVTHAGSLYARGAQHVLVMNLPDLGSTPFGSSSPEMSTQLSQLTQAFNATLSGVLDATGLPVTQVDVYSRFQQIMSDPAAFGLVNVTAASLEDPGVDPSTAFFWDAVHPTAKGHELIADFVIEQLSDQAVVRIDVAGVTTVPTLEVKNLPGVKAGALQLQLAAQDVSAADQAAEFRYLVDWGDGSAPVVASTGAAGVTLSHTFNGSTVARPVVRVIDQDGDSSEAFREAVLWGTTGADIIHVRPGARGAIELVRNGSRVASLDPNNVDRVVVLGLAGNDVLSAAGIGLAVEFDGGNGNDLLIGSKANDRLRGGNGNDVLLGLGGSDVMDGGAGTDLVLGGAGDDSIVGGTSATLLPLVKLLSLTNITSVFRSLLTI